MVQWTHGVERMGRMARACGNTGACGVESGIRVAQAHANAKSCCLGDHFDRTRYFRRDRQHANVSARTPARSDQMQPLMEPKDSLEDERHDGCG